MRECVFRERRAAERQIERHKNQQNKRDGGWECETEGEEEVMKVKREKERERGKQADT